MQTESTIETTNLTPAEAAEAINALAAEMGLTVEWEFVRYSKVPEERRKDWGKSPTINWRYTLRRGAYKPIVGDFTQGCAHLKGYKHELRPTVANEEAIAWACEHGKTKFFYPRDGWPKLEVVEPSLADLLGSLALDASVLDYSNFEDWASDFGYEPDSQKAEKVYRLCLQTALQLRNLLGWDALSKLQEFSRYL